jgi:hypothetical protein
MAKAVTHRRERDTEISQHRPVIVAKVVQSHLAAIVTLRRRETTTVAHMGDELGDAAFRVAPAAAHALVDVLTSSVA